MAKLFKRVWWPCAIVGAVCAVVIHPSVGSTGITSVRSEKIGYLCLGDELAFDFSSVDRDTDGKSAQSTAHRRCRLPLQIPGRQIVSARTSDGKTGVSMNYVTMEDSEAMLAAGNDLLRQGWRETEASALVRKKVDSIETSVFQKNGAIAIAAAAGIDGAPFCRITIVYLQNGD